MPKDNSVQDLRARLENPGGFALIDVRETAEYNLAHIARSCSVPRRLLEFRLRDLVPFRGTDLIVCDDDGRRAGLAAATIESMGYSTVSVLSGGLNRWVTDGLPTEWGVNVPSKDFGEKVLLQRGVPEIEPDELYVRQQRGDKLLILDSRTPEEHQRACIPGSRSMPGAELGLRVWDLIDDPDTTVIVHCAGRTRSIVGAGTLHRLGVKDVFALKNGTMGWQLAGLTLETGSPRTDLPRPSPEGIAKAEGLARAVAKEEGVRYVDVEELKALMAKSESQNVYLFDVRGREEYLEGHIPGFSWVPGGQAVQATDNYVAVNDAVIVFACDGIVRASMTASWFRQMGYANACVLEGGTSAWRGSGLALESGALEVRPFGYEPEPQSIEILSPEELDARQATGYEPKTIHVGTSDEFSAAHVPGSTWVPRSWLELRIADVAPSKQTPLTVTCPDGVNSSLAAASLLTLGYSHIALLAGGLAAWQAAGLPIYTGLTGVTQAPDDVLPARRSYAEMLNYLRWEEELGEKYKPTVR
jgi:rhodanese-related sulfurtransferase